MSPPEPQGEARGEPAALAVQDCPEREAVRQAVEDYLKREAVKQAVEDYLKPKYKQVKIISAILTAILTALGIRTYFDVKKSIREVAEEEVKGFINRNDVEHGIGKILDNLVNRSIMTSSLINLRRPESIFRDKNITLILKERSQPRGANLPPNEWYRLQEWVREESLHLDDFSGSLEVLAAQEDERTQQDARDVLTEMLTARGSEYEWMKRREDKRLAILQNFLHRRGLEMPALEIVTSQEASKELRIAALDYIGSVQDRASFDDLMPLARSDGEEETALRALQTCALVDPLHERLSQEADELTADPRTTKKVKRAVTLAAGIWYAETFTSAETPEGIRIEVERERRARAHKLLAYAFNKRGPRIVVLPREIVAIYVDSQHSSVEVFGVPKEDFSRLEPYWKLIEEAAKQKDVSRLARLTPRSQARTGLNALQLELLDSAIITVSPTRTAGGKELPVVLSRASGVPRVVLARSRESELQRADFIDVHWTDKSGQERSGSLVSLEGNIHASFPREFY